MSFKIYLKKIPSNYMLRNKILKPIANTLRNFKLIFTMINTLIITKFMNMNRFISF